MELFDRSRRVRSSSAVAQMLGSVPAPDHLIWLNRQVPSKLATLGIWCLDMGLAALQGPVVACNR